MKNLIVYFSLEGNTRFMAQSIANYIDCDTLELIPEKNYSTGKIGKYFWGGRSVLFKDKPKLINKDVNINDYKNIIIGTPVWCNTYAPPFNTFFMNHDIKYKNIALFACHGGGGAEKCFNSFKNVLKDNNFIGNISFLDPLKDDIEKIERQISDWVAEVIK